MSVVSPVTSVVEEGAGGGEMSLLQSGGEEWRSRSLCLAQGADRRSVVKGYDWGGCKVRAGERAGGLAVFRRRASNRRPRQAQRRLGTGKRRSGETLPRKATFAVRQISN